MKGILNKALVVTLLFSQLQPVLAMVPAAASVVTAAATLATKAPAVLAIVPAAASVVTAAATLATKAPAVLAMVHAAAPVVTAAATLATKAPAAAGTVARFLARPGAVKAARMAQQVATKGGEFARQNMKGVLRTGTLAATVGTGAVISKLAKPAVKAVQPVGFFARQLAKLPSGASVWSTVKSPWVLGGTALVAGCVYGGRKIWNTHQFNKLTEKQKAAMAFSKPFVIAKPGMISRGLSRMNPFSWFGGKPAEAATPAAEATIPAFDKLTEEQKPAVEVTKKPCDNPSCKCHQKAAAETTRSQATTDEVLTAKTKEATLVDSLDALVTEAVVLLTAKIDTNKEHTVCLTRKTQEDTPYKQVRRILGQDKAFGPLNVAVSQFDIALFEDAFLLEGKLEILKAEIAKIKQPKRWYQRS